MPFVKPGTELPIDMMHFDSQAPPGIHAPYSGIYKCTNCGYEVASAVDFNLPQRDGDRRHEMWTCSGPFKWQLVALAIQLPESQEI